MIKLRTKAKTPWDSKRMRGIDATKNERGITLVALIVTIVVLVILAAVSILNIRQSKMIEQAVTGTEKYTAAQMEEIDVLESKAKFLEEAVKSITEAGNGNGETPENPEEPKEPETPEEPDEPVATAWTQDKTRVTNGVVTLEVGDAVTGYTGNGVGDRKLVCTRSRRGKAINNDKY